MTDWKPASFFYIMRCQTSFELKTWWSDLNIYCYKTCWRFVKQTHCSTAVESFILTISVKFSLFFFVLIDNWSRDIIGPVQSLWGCCPAQMRNQLWLSRPHDHGAINIPPNGLKNQNFLLIFRLGCLPMSREHDKQSVRCAGWELRPLAGVRCWRHLRLLQTHVHRHRHKHRHRHTDTHTDARAQTLAWLENTYTHVHAHFGPWGRHWICPTEMVFLGLTTLISWRVQMNARADYLAWRVAGHCSSKLQCQI